MLRSCPKCGLKKDLEKEFSKCAGNKNGHQSYCKMCSNTNNKIWFSVSPEKKKTNWRRNRLKVKYGLTLDNVEEMRRLQGDRCVISGRILPLNPHVDHDHKTFLLFVRGLLDQHINRALGLFDHSPVWLRRAADYIEDNVARYWEVGPRSDYELHLVKEKAA